MCFSSFFKLSRRQGILVKRKKKQGDYGSFQGGCLVMIVLIISERAN